MRVSENEWLTHSNGGRPFLVKLNDDTLNVYNLLHEDIGTQDIGAEEIEMVDGDTYRYCVRYDVEWCLPATDAPVFNDGREVWGWPEQEWEGYCILAKIQGANEVVFIGREIATFPLFAEERLEADDRVPDAPSFYSTSCSNDVWYPVARTNHATYVLCDHMSTGPILRLPHGRIVPEDYDNEYPGKAFDPFSMLFGDRGDVDFDNIGQVVASVRF